MYKKVLIPVSGENRWDRSLKALKKALEVCDGEIILLHVTEQLAHTLGGTAREQLAAENQAKGLLLVGPLIEVLQQENAPFHTRIESGIVEEVIVRVAQEENVDLIIMFTDGRNGIGDLLLGSITERVLRDTDRDVLAVRK